MSQSSLGALEAELLLQPEHVAAQAGMDLPAVPPRGAARDAVGLDQHHVGAGLGQMEGGRKAGEAAADDADVGAARAVERGVFGHVAERRAGRRTAEAREAILRRDRASQTLSSRYSRSHGLITPMKVSYSVSLMAR